VLPFQLSIGGNFHQPTVAVVVGNEKDAVFYGHRRSVGMRDVGNLSQHYNRNDGFQSGRQVKSIHFVLRNANPKMTQRSFRCTAPSRRPKRHYAIRRFESS
jgi:hypothetical protein